MRALKLIDVFATGPYRGNPLAVVIDSEGLAAEQMQCFTHWMNLSETAFLLPARDPEADYRVRIFLPTMELPFAGHPTLGSCHAWLENGGQPKRDDVIVQECGAGLVPIRRSDDRLAFAAPPLLRGGPVEEDDIGRVVRALRIAREEVLAAQWVDNGPGWVAVMLASADAVLAVQPGLVEQTVGVVGPYPPGAPEAFEVRAFFPKDGSTVEDPVTGSLNASLAQWLLASGRAQVPYVASQGTALGRRGRVHISQDGDGAVWVGGTTVTRVTGMADL